MSEELYELCEGLKKEIRQLNSKPDISPTELDRLYKAVDIIKDIKTIEAMEEAGYSEMYPYSYDDGMSYARGRNSYDGMSYARGRNSYEGRGYSNNSYARGRDSMGRYTSRDDGSMVHENKEYLKRQIEEMQAKLDRM